MFTAMGADGFAERTSRELEATGETVRKRSNSTAVELTTQEGYIARLAREGHMGKIFTKLGVSSRKELRSTELPVP